MRASIGDSLHIHTNHLGTEDHYGRIVEIRGADGAPPYLVEVDWHILRDRRCRRHRRGGAVKCWRRRLFGASGGKNRQKGTQACGFENAQLPLAVPAVRAKHRQGAHLPNENAEVLLNQLGMRLHGL